MKASEVVIVRARDAAYPTEPPFSPDRPYPENAYGDVSAEPNAVYSAVRECFRAGGLDPTRFGTPEWNPLRDLIAEGERVVLKPNFVKEAHPRDPEGWRYVLTHGSVVRAVADYVFLAVGASGRVTIADAPQTDSSFDRVVARLGLRDMQIFYERHGRTLELIDLRREEWHSVGGVIVNRRPLAGDPRGAVAYDLAERSEFVGHRGEGHYYGADYDIEEVNVHHSNGKHEYLLAGSVMEADVIFSLPKLKTHKKAGVTLTMKNLVGINADKNWLPHHTEGSLHEGGDERPGAGVSERIERTVVRQLHRLLVAAPGLGRPIARLARRGGTRVFGDTEEVIRSGNWWGNDTVWRMSLDLNKLALYGGSEGRIHDEPVRRHYSLVDGIIAGHRRGPMNPDPLPAGLLLFGTNAASVDAAATVVMGFDPEKVPTVRNAFHCRTLPLVSIPWQEVTAQIDGARYALTALPAVIILNAEPHFAWAGHIEAER